MPSTTAEAIEILELYNSKASELNDSSLLRIIKETGFGSFELTGGPFRAVRKGGPDPEATKAFLFTFRTFYRDGDGISFREIDQLYRELPVSKTLKEEITVIRSELARYLEGPTPLITNGERIVRRDLLDTWLYGAAAHFNRAKRTRLKHWGVADDIGPLFEYEFLGLVAAVLQSIFSVRNTNLAALKELGCAA